MKIGASDAVIGFPCESTPGDRRTLLTPTVARALTEAGFTVIAEQAIAAGIDCPDAVLHGEGVHFADTSGVWSTPLVLRYKCTDPDGLALLTSAGFSRLRFLPGYGGLSEIVAQTGSGDSR